MPLWSAGTWRRVIHCTFQLVYGFCGYFCRCLMFWLRVAGNLRVLVLVKNGFGYWNVTHISDAMYERWTCLACFLGVFEISAVFFFYHFFFWVFALLGIQWRSAIAEYISLVAFFDVRIIRSLFSGFTIPLSTSLSRMCFKIIESLQSRRISGNTKWLIFRGQMSLKRENHCS